MTDAKTLRRTVGFWGTALLPANGMIGSGIFALPAIMFAAVGNFAPWMMLLGALLILPLVYVFAALSTRFETSGGPPIYVHAAFGSFLGFQSGWTRFASGVVAIAANTHVAVAYLAVLFPVLNDPRMRAAAVISFLSSRRS
jgi:amino acid transporter